MHKITLLFIFTLSLLCATPMAAEIADTTAYGREQHLGEAGVRTHRKATAKMWSSAEHSELITTAGLRVAACCNLGESFVNSAAVDVNYSDAATGARQIRLLGLSGTYVQMLTENYPNLRTVAAPYGLNYIPGPWMQSIQVSKGITSVKQGFEAMTGQINVEYKKPQAPRPDLLNVNLYANSRGSADANADATFILPSGWGTTLLAHYNKDFRHHDMNKDGFADMPQTEQFNFMNRWHYRAPHYEFQIGARALDESRRSGQLSPLSTQLSPLSPHPFRIDINAHRIEGFMKNAYISDCDHGCNIALILSGSYHDQRSAFGNREAAAQSPAYRFTQYDVAQTSLYGSLMYEGGWQHDRHTLSTGISALCDMLSRTTLGTQQPVPHRTHEAVGGIYAQYAYNMRDLLLIQPGLRLDYSSLWGTFVTPRLHIKYAPNHHWNLRLSAGRGFRTSFPLDESTYLLSSARTIHGGTEPLREANWNAGASVQWRPHVAGHVLDVTADYFFTTFQRQAVIDFDRHPQQLWIYPLQGKSFSHVAQLELSYPFFTGFTATAAFRWTDARCTYLTASGNRELRERPLTSRYKGLLTLQYRTPDQHWQFDATASINGPGRLPLGLEDATFPPFPGLTAQITYNIGKWSLYAGGENLTNFTQKHPIISASNPWSDTFDPTVIWGPMDGWMLYAGLRFNLPR